MRAHAVKMVALVAMALCLGTSVHAQSMLTQGIAGESLNGGGQDPAEGGASPASSDSATSSVTGLAPMASPPPANPSFADNKPKWRELNSAGGSQQVLLFCSVKSVWCGTVKPMIAQWAVQTQATNLVLLPAVAGMDDVPFAKAQIALETLAGYAPAFDLSLAQGFAKGLDPSNSMQVENWVRSQIPARAEAFVKVYEDPKTELQARKDALLMRSYGIKSVPSIVVNNRCVISPENVTRPEDYLPRLKQALVDCQ